MTVIKKSTWLIMQRILDMEYASRMSTFNARTSILYTAKNNFDIRLWSIPSKKLHAKIKYRLDNLVKATEGKVRGSLRAIDSSPEGDIIALGCTYRRILDKSYRFFSRIFFVDVSTKKIVCVSKRMKDNVTSVAFSKDGCLLVVSTWSQLVGGYVYAYRIERLLNKIKASLVMDDDDYFEDPYCCSFDCRNRFIVVGTRGEDGLGIMHLYDKTAKLIKYESLPDREDFIFPDAKFSPDGKHIAVAYGFSFNVDVYSGANLSYMYSAYPKISHVNFACVTWSRDGKYLYAAGKDLIRRWSGKGLGRPKDIFISEKHITYIYPLDDGCLLYGNEDKIFGIINQSGQEINTCL